MQPFSWIVAMPAGILLMVLLCGCGEGSVDGQSRQAKNDLVQIIALDPPLSQPLSSGSTVDFSIGVKYAVQQAGRLTLRIQAAGEGRVPLVSERKALPAGEGRVNLSVSITVPEAAALQIMTILEPRGPARSVLRDSRVYKVEHVPGTVI